MGVTPERRKRGENPFQDVEPPKPFFRTRIGVRIAIFAVLLVIAGMIMLSQRRRAERSLERAAAEAEQAAAVAAARPSAEQLEERRRTLGTLFEGAMADTSNGDDFVETPGYRKLIEVLTGSTPEDVAQRIDADADLAAIVEEPDWYRGEYVRVRGLLGGLFAYKLDQPAHDVTDVWRGTIVQQDGAVEAVVIDFVGQPPELEPRRSVVEVEGIFYRTVAFESRSGEQQVAPYVLARTLRVLPGKAAQPHYARAKLLITICGVGAIVAYFLVRYSARTRKGQRTPKPVGFRKMFERSSGGRRPDQSHEGPRGS